MKPIVLVFWPLLGLPLLATSGTGPKIGDLPPLLEASTLLQAPPEAKLNAASLRGKVVILEFWATWCGPCVASIPHLNRLAEKFKDQPVQFVAITPEDEPKIKAFLAKRAIKAWVALDTNNAMNQAYGVTAIPHTVVLGRDGVIAAITHPDELTEEQIKDLLAGRRISFAGRNSESQKIQQKSSDEPQPLFQVMVRPSAYTNSTGWGGGGRFMARGYTIWELLPRAFDQPLQSHSRLQTNGPLPEGRYDFVVMQTKGPTGNENALEKNVSVLLQQALKSAFGLSGRKETREVDAMFLRVKGTNAPGLVPCLTAGGGANYRPGLVEGTDMSMTGLALALEYALNKPVFDETGVTNHYDVLLKWDQTAWDRPNPEGLMKALQEQLGLELVPCKRPVEMLVVEQENDNESRHKN